MHRASRWRRTCARTRQEQESSRKRSGTSRFGKAPRKQGSHRGRTMKGIFAGKALIGVVHLRPLPGSPGWKGSLDAVLKFAVDDARAYEQGGVHALFIENFGDVPFTKGSVGPET